MPSNQVPCDGSGRHGPVVKVLPVSGQWPMRQLALRVHFLRCGGLLNDWPFEGVLSMVAVRMASLLSTGPNTS
ncbi:hypothetical protein TNCV_2272931 [Trichonephila clavipes]|nr:hypothetical protein TNCV_2272931 [Trichonephila clavipes]